MAGRKQHYLPQFLQRPFNHRTSKGRHYVYVFFQDRHFEAETAGVGAERGFYSDLNDPTADELITAAEVSQGNFLKEVIASQKINDQSSAAILFASLSIRTFKAREALRDLAPKMLHEIQRKAQEEDWALKSINEYLGNPRNLEDAIEQALRKQGSMHREQRVKARLHLRRQFAIELPNIMPEWVQQARSLANDLLSKLTNEAASIADRAFIQIFESDDPLKKRQSWFSEFNYEARSAKTPLILGDCAVVAIDNKSNPRLPITDQDDHTRLDQLYLPISPNLYAIGKRSDSLNELTPDELNTYSSQLSSKFFVSNSNDKLQQSLQSQISALTHPVLSVDELRRIAQ